MTRMCEHPELGPVIIHGQRPNGKLDCSIIQMYKLTNGVTLHGNTKCSIDASVLGYTQIDVDKLPRVGFTWVASEDEPQIDDNAALLDSGFKL